jgi:hypothetical protein
LNAPHQMRRRSLLGTVTMKGGVVQWSSYVAYFFGGVFLVNSIPHLTSGVSGYRLPIPFASPFGKGQSSPTVNVLYGSANLAVGYLLACQVGDFHVRRISDVLALGVGGLLMGVVLSQLFVYLQRPMGGRDGLVAAQATLGGVAAKDPGSA